LMTDTQPTTTEALFPSTQFLQTHFGDNLPVPFNPHRGEVASQLHDVLRHLIASVLLTGPVHLLKAMNHKGGDSQPVTVFQNGQLAQWVDPALEGRGLQRELSVLATTKLCDELIAYCQKPAVRYGMWWQWEVYERSVWIEVTPDAIAAGKNRPRTLAEILKSNPGDKYLA